MDIVKVRYYSETTGAASGREYSYYTEEPLAVGDLVKVPLKDHVGKAVVTAVGVPEIEIAPFKAAVKVIVAGSIIKHLGDGMARAIAEELPSLEEKGAVVAQLKLSPQEEVNKLSADLADNHEILTAAVVPAEKVAELKKDWDNLKGHSDPVIIREPAEAADVMVPAGMHLVKVSTDADLAVRSLFEEGVKILGFAKLRVILNNNDLKPAVDDLSLIAKLKKALVEKKGEYVNPIKKDLDLVNGLFAEIMAPFEEADRITRGKVQAFREEVARKAAEAADIETMKADLAAREAKLNGTGEITVPLGTAVPPPPVPDRVRTDQGTVGTMKVHKWKVVDLALVPAEYKTVDAAKVQSVVKASKGTIVIPGIEIWTEGTTTVRAH